MTIKTKADLVKLDTIWRGLPMARVMAGTSASTDMTLDRVLKGCPSPFYGGAASPPPPPPPSSNTGRFFITF